MVRGELCVAVQGFHRKGALPMLGGPQTDGSGTAADSQLPRQVRAVGHKQDQLTPTPNFYPHPAPCTPPRPSPSPEADPGGPLPDLQHLERGGLPLLTDLPQGTVVVRADSQQG